MVDGPVDVTLLLEPRNCPLVQRRLEGRFPAAQLRPEQVAEETVVSVPLAPPIKRDDKEVRMSEVFQDRCRVATLGDRIAEGTGELVEH